MYGRGNPITCLTTLHNFPAPKPTNFNNIYVGITQLESFLLSGLLTTLLVIDRNAVAFPVKRKSLNDALYDLLQVKNCVKLENHNNMQQSCVNNNQQPEYYVNNKIGKVLITC